MSRSAPPGPLPDNRGAQFHRGVCHCARAMIWTSAVARAATQREMGCVAQSLRPGLTDTPQRPAKPGSTIRALKMDADPVDHL